MRLQLATNGPRRRFEGSYASVHLKRSTMVEPPTLLTAWIWLQNGCSPDTAAASVLSRQRARCSE